MKLLYFTVLLLQFLSWIEMRLSDYPIDGIGSDALDSLYHVCSCDYPVAHLDLNPFVTILAGNVAINEQ